MTSKERMLAACTGQTPDRVPAAPDMSNMIPCRLTGKPFWDIYLYNDPPLWKAYIDALHHFGTDGWFIYGDMQFTLDAPISWEVKPVTAHPGGGREMVRVLHTPEGDLFERQVSLVADAPTVMDKLVRDVEADFRKLKYLYAQPTGFDPSLVEEQIKALGQDGLYALTVTVPGFPAWLGNFNGGLEMLTYAWMDHPDWLEELRVLHDAQTMKMLEMILDYGKVESVLLGMSGAITLQSPALFDEFSLPTIKKATRMCKEAGVVSGLHSCGKEMHIVKTCATETDLNYINPLEVPPMGDCTLAEAKRLYGEQIAIMGNLHTTEVMLRGTVAQVRRAALEAIRDAGAGGGFVLSTGDQCGRDTPEENMRELVRVGEEYGRYPLDMDAIEAEIRRLEGMA